MFIFLNRATKPPPPVSSKSQSLASHRLRLLNELSRELFVAHACRATVAILDADDQLPVGSVSATFVLSYLQAFPEALRRSADEPEEDANPVVMLGRKLHGLVAREEERAAKERNLAESAVDTSLTAYVAQSSPKALEINDEVWVSPNFARGTVVEISWAENRAQVRMRDGVVRAVGLSDVKSTPPPRVVRMDRLAEERAIARELVYSFFASFWFYAFLHAPPRRRKPTN